MEILGQTPHEVDLVGLLAMPQLYAQLALGAVQAPAIMGKLVGGADAGIVRDGFPVLDPGMGEIATVRTEWTSELRRYAEIFGLSPVTVQDRQVLGISASSVAMQGQGDAPSNPRLAAAMAAWLLGLPADMPASKIRSRLPQIAGWVSSRLRAEDDNRALPETGPQGADRLLIESRDEPYADYFSVEKLGLRFQTHSGQLSDRVEFAVFVSGDATVVLPWDPKRDRVLLIDQMRAAPAARGDAQPWLYETIAGRIDGGETPQQAAKREALEEAGLTIDHLIPGPNNYPSPGAVAEYLYMFIAIADLPDDCTGIGGLDSESEDIRSHLVPRTQLTEMALDGRLRNGPLALLAMWLELKAPDLLRQLDRPIDVQITADTDA